MFLATTRREPIGSDSGSLCNATTTSQALLPLLAKCNSMRLASSGADATGYGKSGLRR